MRTKGFMRFVALLIAALYVDLQFVRLLGMVLPPGGASDVIQAVVAVVCGIAAFDVARGIAKRNEWI